jgi:hypothetical protein
LSRLRSWGEQLQAHPTSSSRPYSTQTPFASALPRRGIWFSFWWWGGRRRGRLRCGPFWRLVL